MKKWIVLLFVVCVMASLLCGCDFDSEPTHRNCTISSVDEACVIFYPKCPKCSHLNKLAGFYISKGESHSAYSTCDSCGELYEVYVSR